MPEWGRIRTGAASILAWKVGIAAASFPQLTLSEVAAKADELGLSAIAGSSSQNISPEIPKKLDYNLAPGEVTWVKEKLRAANVRMPAYQVPAIDPAEPAMRKLFEFAKSLGVEAIILASDPSRALTDKLANEYSIRVARPDDNNRVVVDLTRAGVTNLPAFLRQAFDGRLKPALIIVDPGSIERFEEALRPIIADRVNEISRTAAIRGPDRLSPDDRNKIQAALPDTAPAKPKKPRQLLVMDLNVGYPGHRSIPHANLAIESMGKKTGAYEAVFSNDLGNLKYDKIRQFDAVYLNNTVGMIFPDSQVRDGLIRFIREGGGLGGNHATSHASMDWSEFGEMLGAKGGSHREPTERAVVKIDDPAGPLTAPFGGEAFLHEDEFFRYVPGLYSREKLRVLLSIDVEKTDMNQGRPCARCFRPDHDYGLSWIRSYGKGRVFYCALGHGPAMFTTPALVQHLLAGLQFILGDLEADTTPSARLATKLPAGIQMRR
jgi:type 1 glutamine amidotransferase